MDLKLSKRLSGKKSEIGRIRREGNIPAVVYGHKKENTPVVIEGAAFEAHLRAIPKGCLATQVFHVEYEGKKHKAIIKDITYNRVTYAIEHIDLMQVTDNEMVSVHVPIVCKGAESCAGVTLGGQIKYVKRSVKVSVKLSEMPASFVFDLTELALNQSIRITDVQTTPSMRVASNQGQILITVAK